MDTANLSDELDCLRDTGRALDTSFDALKDKFLVLALGDEGNGVPVDTLVARESLEHLDKSLWCELFRPFLRNLHNNTKVCTDAILKQLGEALNRFVRGKLTEEVLKMFNLHVWSMAKNALVIFHVAVELESAVIQTNVLATHRDLQLVEVAETVVGAIEDSVGNPGVVDEVDLQDAGLESSIFLAIPTRTEVFQEDVGSGLHIRGDHEGVGKLANIHERAAGLLLLANENESEILSAHRIDSVELANKSAVVWSVVLGLGIADNLGVDLICLTIVHLLRRESKEAGNDLLRYLGLGIDLKSKLEINALEGISELLRAG
mmetsp:Transcript_18277/g.34924  ORF Transcript_18277/g.34924 Transcript_18277/m.34924 type:complete len:319 (+) Transcript_18277:3083-4039(+)